MVPNIKPIALYLPQYHPIPENDAWWGKGFTEWTNVTKATPRFKGHHQPHLPADLGFYDLRLEEARMAQESMAKTYGIYGFCYYHYWFNGQRILHQPLDRKLANVKEDLPFMLCWANENWTRAWDGQQKDILLSQQHSDADDEHHARFLCEAYFQDTRYIRHEGKPVFIFYRPSLFPDIKNTLRIFRNEAQRAGIGELWLGYFQGFNVKTKPQDLGFDFGAEFQPDFSNRPKLIQTSFLPDWIEKIRQIITNYNTLSVHEYDDFAQLQMQRPFQPDVYPCITPMWDNTARRKHAPFILHNSTPEKYGAWLQHIIKNYPWKKSDADFLFLNAWNEWAEGNHLEPCQRWGLAYLQKTHEVFSQAQKQNQTP